MKNRVKDLSEAFMESDADGKLEMLALLIFGLCMMTILVGGAGGILSELHLFSVPNWWYERLVFFPGVIFVLMGICLSDHEDCPF